MATISHAAGDGMSDSEDAGRATRSPWGALLHAVAAYDFSGFEYTARVAVLSSVPDWPW